MTSDTDKDSPEAGAADQRPHATLDLTATEIFPGGKPRNHAREPQAALPPGDNAPPHVASPDDGHPAVPHPATMPDDRREAGLRSFLTHMAAGLIGAALALVIAFYAFGNFRDVVAARTGGDVRSDFAAVRSRIAALETTGKTTGGEANGFDLRLKTASDQTGALKQEVAALGRRLQILEAQPADASGPSPETVQQSIQPLTAKLAELDMRVATLTRTQEELRATTGSAALSMAVQNLRRAVSEGKPFAAELKTLTALSAEPLEVAPLEARRDSGLSSLARLQRDFEASAKAAVSAARGPGDGTFTGDLLAKARGLVRVRPTGEVAGSTPEAILARAERRLDAGELPAAIGEAGQLAGAAADAMMPWLTEAKAKAAADETLTKLEAKLMTSLGADERAKKGG